MRAMGGGVTFKVGHGPPRFSDYSLYDACMELEKKYVTNDKSFNSNTYKTYFVRVSEQNSSTLSRLIFE